jgi:hypothetical protein
MYDNFYHRSFKDVVLVNTVLSVLSLSDCTIKTHFCSGYSFLNHQSGGSWYCRRQLKLTIEQPASVIENLLISDLCVRSACPVSV